MEWIPVYTPRSEPELMVVVSLLDAHAIPHFVHNAGFGGLFPGPQISLYNTRTVMIPAAQAAAARELLADFQRHDPADESTYDSTPATWRDKIRMIAETLFFGWFVPSGRRASDRSKRRSSRADEKNN